MKLQKQLTCLVLAIMLIFSLFTPSLAAVSDEKLFSLEKDAAEYILSSTPKAGVGSIGGEWAVIGLARATADVPESYFESYYALLEQYLDDCGGVLHRRKYTEYSRVILAVTAIGRDARNVAGYDLTAPLGDYEATVFQGINGPIWALIALDSGSYPMPVNTGSGTQASRDMYIDYILSAQNPDGGWSLDGGDSDVDVTAMALQALSKYTEKSAVSAAIESGFDYISGVQLPSGGFLSDGTENSESCAQVIVALCENGISVDDSRFVKNGRSVLDALLGFYRSGSGFSHSASGSGASQMSSEQGFYALAALCRVKMGLSSLYSMSESAQQPGQGSGFADIQGHKNQPAIEALAARGIINGRSETSFAPNDVMTRAEFSAIVVRALGIQGEKTGAFSDVTADKWYAQYVGAAHASGIVNGVGGGKFAPGSTITRQEAAVMAVRAAKICGIDTGMTESETEAQLSGFTDGALAAGWSHESLAFCYASGLLPGDEASILPGQAILRCEIAQLLYELMTLAELI